jgi:hypothetical protein
LRVAGGNFQRATIVEEGEKEGKEGLLGTGELGLWRG